MPEELQEPQEQNETQPEAPEPEQAAPAAEEPEGPAEEPAEAEAAAERQEAPPAPPAAPAESGDAPAEDAVPPEEAVPAEGTEAGEPAEVPGPEFGVAVEDVGPLKKKIVVTVPEAMIEAKRNEMFGELSDSAQVPGFRIGRAPRRLIEKRFGREVGRDVRNALIGESLRAAMDKSELKVLGEPDLDLDAIELPEEGDLVYDMEVEVAPEFELPELEGIPVQRVASEVADEYVDQALDRIRLSQAKYELTDGPAAEQDGVVVSARISGEGIDGTTTTATLRVAPGQVEGLPLVELGKELAGKKAGDTAVLTVKVPAVHPNEAWRDKEATVELTINEVRQRILPEIDDEYARQRGYDSLAEYREDLASQMGSRLQLEARRALRRQITDYLLANTRFDLPEGVASRHELRVLQRRYVDLLQAGYTHEQIQERMTEIQATVSQEAHREMKLNFILGKIADAEEIEVTAEEINARVAQIAAYQQRRPERVRQELESDGSLMQVEVAIREEKVVEKLLESADMMEEGAGPEADDAGAAPEAPDDRAAPDSDAAPDPADETPDEQDKP